ncbi:hypothetical protein [Anderseniella sp. Alg231-50]|uniref:hypothetical protein n=1 Tax=Anderseniella sp. Alg231-50 TaxID=1922226 RepID=UPI000D553242
MKLLQHFKNLRGFSRRSAKTPSPKREIVSWWLAAFTAGVLMLAVGYAADTKLFMPGPLTSSHSTLEQCSDCHSNVSKGQFGWVHAVFATADPRKDSSSCLTCHKMGEEVAHNPHGLEMSKLDAYVREIKAQATATTLPVKSRVRKAVFPVDSTFKDGVFCATCHKEHQGGDIKLRDMADAQCHTCHQVQFESFNTDHPDFDKYPFRRRTRVNFDHTGHFGKHFPEWKAKKENAGTTPESCSGCHTVSAQEGHMNVKPFAESCAACHLGQIVGAERATGPKGIAMLMVPGVDVATFREKKIDIGNWPDESEAELSSLMKLLIGRTEEGRKILAATDGLDLLDLTQATPEQISQVENLVWEVKHLFHGLANSGTSDILKQLGSDKQAPVDQQLLINLTASMPRDVLVGALRDWLPKLGEEIAQRGDGKRADVPAATTTSDASGTVTVDGANAEQAENATMGPTRNIVLEKPAGEQKPSGPIVLVQQTERWRVDPFGRLLKGNQPPEEDEEEDTADEPDAADEPEDQAADDTDGSDDQDASEPEDSTADAETDTEADTDADSDLEVVEEDNETEPLELDTDAESWAQLGGWYRQDYSILYKPTGHADTFMKSWLDFTAVRFSKAESNLAAGVFTELTGKDAQGQCTKCHSVDAAKDQARTMQWAPSSNETSESLFTSFNHQPHLGVVSAEKGCLTCHETSSAKGYLETYKANDPKKFVSNFAPVKKETCASCHGKKEVRQDCLLCHKYHVNDIITPITQTKIPEK